MMGKRNREKEKEKEKERRKETHRNMHGEFGNEISHKTDISLEARGILDTRAKHQVFMHHDNEKWKRKVGERVYVYLEHGLCLLVSLSLGEELLGLEGGNTARS